MWDALTNGLVSFAVSVINLFPASPFLFLQDLAGNSTMADILAMVNWFVPIYSFVAILETWLGCVALYYVYQIVMRWLKVVS